MTKTRSEKVEQKARMGRPRDGSIRRKVIDAAIECYEELGWSGFNFESVSVRAKVGRPALYRRWSNREELLIDAFRELTPALPAAPDHGNLREDLTEVAMEYRRVMLGARGRAGVRLFIEQEATADVFHAVAAEISAYRNSLIVETLKRGQSRGEVRSDADLQVATELLVGALMLDALYAPGPYQVRGIVAKTVDMLLRGLGNNPVDRDTAEATGHPV
jgi:AcrR family transcriptional regulator